MSSEFGYYRHPTISNNTIVFVCEDDLWTVAAGGGIARRLTVNPGAASFPVFSPDGQALAFTGRDDGPAETYVMSAEGGIPRRLTWLGARSQTLGWTRDGHGIIAATDWQQPFAGDMRPISVGTTGSAPEFLGYGPARALSFGPKPGSVVIGRNSGDPSRWKRYRGGTAGTLWIDRQGDGKFSELIRLDGNLANPMWLGSRIFFLSDHEGHGNLYSCTPTGRGLKRHTEHEDFYVRFPSSDGQRVVYHGGADVFIFDPEGNTSGKVEIGIHSSFGQRNRKFVGASRYLEGFDLHPEGHSLLSVHRGGLHAMGLWEGASRRLGQVSRARYRLGSWLPDGERVVAVTDEGGEESLVLFTMDGSKEPRKIQGDFGRATGLTVAPAQASMKEREKKKAAKGKKKRTPKAGKTGPDLVALTNNRHELILVNLTDGSSRVLDRSPHRRIDGVAWSPDSLWLAYGLSTSLRSSCIRLCNVDSGKITSITRPDFFDTDPSFNPDGAYLYFISWRTFNPVYDSHYFDLGFPKGSRPYLVTLEKETVSPFSTATQTPRPPGASPDDEDETDDTDGEPSKIRIDLEGIEDRTVAFPVREGRYWRILGAKGRALFGRQPVEGGLDEEDEYDREPASDGTIEFWDFKKNGSGRVSDGVTDFCLSLNRKVLGIRSGNRVRALPASFKEDPEKDKDEFSRQSGWVDLGRIRAAVVPIEEWRQMYDEAWRLQREQFWSPDMSGVDWQKVRERYLSILDRVGSRTEFSDLMWEMQGELGTSHCYEMGGDYRPRPNWRQGYLGADLSYNRRTRNWRIEKIPRGDSWDAESCSPLAAPGLDIHAGDEIVAIAGETLSEHVSPYDRLIHLADKEVQITVRPRRRSGGSRTVTVKALRDETPLRYRDWVEANRSRVHDETDQRVGYLHVPDMGPHGYAEFHRYFGQESDRDGLIVDVRYNRGGHVSQLLLEKLLRRRIGYDISRWCEPMPYPDAAPMGPMVALTNEHAGSDGDIFCHAFKLFGLGPLIGKRTWGGVIGIWPQATLVDGTVTTQPEYACWFEDVGYEVENYGTEPDIEVNIRPQDYAAGRDPQMERAIVEIKKEMRRKPSKKPGVGGRQR